MKNEYKVTKKLMLSWGKEYYLFGAANVVLFILWVVAGLVGLANIVIGILLEGAWKNLCLGIVLLLLALFKLLVSRYIAWYERYKLYAGMYGVSEWMRTTDFAQDGITLADHTSLTKVRYENVKKIKEKGNVVMIFLSHGLAIRLYKDAFTEGTWDECKELISTLRK